MRTAIITSLVTISLLAASFTAAETSTDKNAQFKTGTLTSVKAKQKHGNKLANVSSNQLFICNMTNLPNQIGTAIQVSFPQAGVPDQLTQPGNCAYLSNDYGHFVTQVVIYTPANSGYVDFNYNVSSGEMWSVTYDINNNTYPVAQIQ